MGSDKRSIIAEFHKDSGGRLTHRGAGRSAPPRAFP